ncbi:hypothetical protein C8J56DRAFT_757882, partial [Mycena floridula]
YLKKAMDINKALNHFFTEPSHVIEFRHALLETKALISGSFALQYFDRQCWSGSDLDVYVTANAAHALIDKVLNRGYRECPGPFDTVLWHKRIDKLESIHDDYPDSMKRSVVNLYNKDRRHIQIIIVGRTPFDTIMGYHSTVVMNIITGDRGCCLYPLETLGKRRNLVTGTYNPAKKLAVEKYQERGWEGILFDLDSTSSTFDTRCRAVGDRHTWSIDFGD